MDIDAVLAATEGAPDEEPVNLEAIMGEEKTATVPATTPAPPADAVWLKREDESGKAFRAFCCYRDLGPGRSLSAAYALYKGCQKGVKRVSGFFQRWSVDFDWVARTQAYDAYLEAQARQEQEALWHERRVAQAERQWKAGQLLLDKVEQMGAFPLASKKVVKETERTDADGNKVIERIIEVRPADWRMADAARLAKVGTEISRQAAGMDQKAAGTEDDPIHLKQVISFIEVADADDDSND